MTASFWLRERSLALPFTGGIPAFRFAKSGAWARTVFTTANIIDDLPVVMEAIIAEMRKNSDWSRIRPDFRGAFMVAQQSADSGALLMRFIRSLQLPKYPGWLSTTVKGAKWWEE